MVAGRLSTKLLPVGINFSRLPTPGQSAGYIGSPAARRLHSIALPLAEPSPPFILSSKPLSRFICSFFPPPFITLCSPSSLERRRLPEKYTKMVLQFGRCYPLRVLHTAKIFCSPCIQSAPPVFFSTNFVGDKPMLVRDFIRAALYDPNHGYFSKLSGPVGMLEKSIRFNQLQGRDAYLQYLDKLYKQHDVAWFTPVELFKPWYAHAIAEAILRTANLSVPLRIYEIGGGSGTCAKCIMDYMMLNAPERVYNNMTYISVEISPTLVKRQLETVGEVSRHLDHYRVEHRDALDRSGWRHADPNPCWVIMLEVLDNLPHDLVYSSDQVSPWMEVWIEKELDSLQVSETYKPLQDTLISQCIKIIGMDKDENAQERRILSVAREFLSKAFPMPHQAWLPTGCLQLLEVLHWALPKMSLIASDFSYLPDVRIMGDRAPLVSTKKDGVTVDHTSYLDAKGESDIFFPTDFWLLERIDHHCSGWLNETKSSRSSKQAKMIRSIILDTGAFMEEFGLPSKTRTMNGYNPLLDDFKNTKFYLSVPTHNIK